MGRGSSPGQSRHSQESTTGIATEPPISPRTSVGSRGHVAIEPPISPRTSVSSRGQIISSPPSQPKFSLASPQPSQFLRNSQKSIPDINTGYYL